MKSQVVTKLKIYPHPIPKICPFCLMNESQGYTDWGIVGCRFCQEKVDNYMSANFTVRRLNE